MENGASTCWTVVEGAAAGRERDRDEFARRYLPIVRAYLKARWRGSPLRTEVEDAAQDVFLACFKRGGALETFDRGRGGFRPFLFGVVRNVARHAEGRRQRRREDVCDDFDAADLEHDADGVSTLFDRAWARSIMKEAVARQHVGAATPEARRRVELLRLRFQEGLPIREIAARWGAEAAHLHREYPKARTEFLDALVAVMAFHHPGPRGEVERECARLLDALA